jgi:hypothetical protein
VVPRSSVNADDVIARGEATKQSRGGNCGACCPGLLPPLRGVAMTRPGHRLRPGFQPCNSRLGFVGLTRLAAAGMSSD